MSINTAKSLERTKQSEERELTRLYHSGKIPRNRYKENFEAISGWFDCPRCRWEGPYAPIDFSGENPKVYCPECGHLFG